MYLVMDKTHNVSLRQRIYEKVNTVQRKTNIRVLSEFNILAMN